MNLLQVTLNFADSAILPQMRAIIPIEKNWQPCSSQTVTNQGYCTSAVQRFITPQCHQNPMPYQDNASGLIINADAYLTNYHELCQLLNVSPGESDGVLILRAYERFGENCTRHLSGRFMFVIWDTKTQTVFAAVDQKGSIPLFYRYVPEQSFVASNLFSPVCAYAKTLTVNESLFLRFAFDTYSTTETSYQEILKLTPGYQMVVTKQSLRVQHYWHIKDCRIALPAGKREDYFELFRASFERSVTRCMRVLGPVTAQCSGGLDSSSVTAMGAKLLAEKNQKLYALTAVPVGLNGQSYRKGWYYHEMPRIQAILDQYPNIIHTAYHADPTANIFSKLEKQYPHIDQPIRNVTNFDWIIGNYQQVFERGGRALLTGAQGNATISWSGSTLRGVLGASYRALRAKLNPTQLYQGFFQQLHPDVLNSKAGKALLKNRGRFFGARNLMLNSEINGGLASSAYAVQLQHGVLSLDPTGDDQELLALCYSLPNRMYCRGTGMTVLQRRLLVREGLRCILPEAIAQNPYRGEQAADWYLQYNHHQSQWKQQLYALPPQAKDVLWKYYDSPKLLALFDQYAEIVSPPDHKITSEVCLTLLRCMSAGLYLNGLYQ